MASSNQTTRIPDGMHGRGPGLNVKPKNFWGTLGRLTKYLKSYVVSIVFVVALAIGSQIFQIQTPKILGKATTEIFKGVMTGAAMQQKGMKITSYPINYDKIQDIIMTVIVM